MAWIWLIIAGLCEMMGVTFMNWALHRHTWQLWTAMVVAFAGSFGCLELALQTLPMGTAYAIWTGIGAAGGVITGMLFFGESRDWRKLLWVVVILSATVGLKLIA
ncbi:membrane transporter [Levilactobacillus namurensis DSM 19117]|uniref:Membrane transporter n=1 Tax=Levilactobacillus namurensis DSM 19117 TaxID=1423773 RepID=A0A0R1JT59_9LACO|nr:multidrug efflux SMR transporter [Levilactobacillus namurensis]KRK74463.1 membrane transporter [Levilactobacillus namurensis DSM 19117]GEO74235.1 QacE family quaternary ammonium compound efflux SMR transporter [Levilactobacillus namurensis]HJE44171.1 multidrug efflux SMR transporter [Levilactobacillus namurensis]